MTPFVDQRRRRRVRVGFWVAGSLVLVGGGLAAALASVGFEGPAPVRFVAGSEVVSLPTYGEDGSHVLRYRHGGELAFTIPLENQAVVPITVTDLRFDTGPQPMLAIESVAVSDSDEAGADELPFRIGAGATVEVTVTARYTNCRYYHEREIESITAVVVDASAFGVDTTRTVAFDSPFVIHSPMIVECPDRTLRRDDDVRGQPDSERRS